MTDKYNSYLNYFLFLSVNVSKNQAEWEKSKTCKSKPHQFDNVISLKETFFYLKRPLFEFCITDFEQKNEVLDRVIFPWYVHFQCISMKL